MERAKILIVEDDPFSVQLLRHNLKKYPADLLPVANNAADALKIAAQHRPDVALLDIYLNGEEEGLEIAKSLQEDYDIPIIYLTGYASDEIFEDAKHTDPFGYILKPFTPKELKVTLDMALYKHGVAKELKRQRGMLSTTLDVLNEGVITTDEEGRTVYVNPAAQDLLGISQGDELAEYVHLRLPASNQPVELSKEIFESKSAPVCKLRGHDGQDRWVRVCMSGMPHGGDVVVLWDVSAEYETQRTAQTVFKALESITETLLIVNEEDEDKIIFASKALEDLTGWQGPEVQGQSPHFLLGPKSVPHFWENAKVKLRTDDYAKFETLIYNKEGKATLAEWQFSRMKGESKLLICMLRDLSRYRQVEEELRQSQKTEAVGRLAGGIAHDFNNLLSVINSYSDLMTLKLEEENPLRKYVENIRTAGARAADLVAKLLTFSRRDESKPRLLDVKDVTEEIQTMLRRVIEENIEIELDVQDALDVVYADRLHLEQVVMNLCVNARDAISSGGKISIGWTQQALDEKSAQKKGLKKAGEYLVLKISDTGCGMDEQTLERIFDPYFTTKGEGKGTGLGLSIVQGIVAEMKGSVQVTSFVGKGTTFSVYLQATPRAELKPTASVNVIEPEGGQEEIIIVEDEESFVDCLQGIFSDHGYKVHYATNPLEALEKAQRAIAPKLLITDIMMPDMSGKELAVKLKEKFPELKVLFITGYDNPLQFLKDFPYSAVVLQKPFSVVSILGKIREIIHSSTESKEIKIL